MDDTAKRIISSLDGRWKETESGLTGTDRGLLEGRRGGGSKTASTEWNPSALDAACKLGSDNDRVAMSS